ncbi:MAG: AAA family ATPase, partial [Syntrophobacterales bacterium]
MKRIYSIGGGKGGSGKSFIAASLGILLAKQGKSVVLVDLDLGASNLHTLLGQRVPQRGLDAFIDKTTNSLEDVALTTTIPNLHLISSTKCSLEIANLFYAQKLKVINAIKNLPFAYILLDLGPGIHFNTLDFFLIATEGLFVATPEPTAIENTFIFIKSIYLRKLKLALKEANMWHVCQEEVSQLSKGALKSPLDLINILIERNPENGTAFNDLLSGLRFSLILNKFRGQVSEDLGEQLVDVCNRHLYPSFDFLGN